MKHSPEPWGLAKFSGYRDGISAANDKVVVWLTNAIEEGIDNPEDAKRIVECVNACAGIESPTETLANTRLIAAAPDLLELAKTVVELSESRPILKSIAGGSFYKQAKAVLAKVKGDAA